MAHFCSLTNLYCFKIQRGFFSVSVRAVALRLAHNSHVLFLYITRANLSVQSQGTLGKKRMNIETIENG